MEAEEALEDSYRHYLERKGHREDVLKVCVGKRERERERE
jgi:hypothetical protein